jgi:hypothetical protein
MYLHTQVRIQTTFAYHSHEITTIKWKTVHKFRKNFIHVLACLWICYHTKCQDSVLNCYVRHVAIMALEKKRNEGLQWHDIHTVLHVTHQLVRKLLQLVWTDTRTDAKISLRKEAMKLAVWNITPSMLTDIYSDMCSCLLIMAKETDTLNHVRMSIEF